VRGEIITHGATMDLTHASDGTEMADARVNIKCESIMITYSRRGAAEDQDAERGQDTVYIVWILSHWRTAVTIHSE
jgi:hypothetical protein